tara:strand:+ start:11211 stop:12347 length:1137 start_codon:yes stop_codon:yes gene_type:complete
MKIAFIPSTFLPIIGGAEIQTHNLGNKISEKHKVDIFLLKNTVIKKKKYKIKVLPLYLINIVYLFKYYLNLDFTFFYFNYFKKLIKKEKYDIWHFHSLNYKTLLFILVLNKLNQKIAVTFQGADIQIQKNIGYGYRLKKKYNKLFLKTIRKIDIFFSISQNIKRDLLLLKVDKKKIFNIPNAVDFQKVKKIKIERNRYLTILTIGRFAEKKKGFDLIEKVSKHLINKIKFQWIIIGRDTNQLKKKLFYQKNKDNFLILDEIKNDEDYTFPNNILLKYYKRSHVYANMARIESFGITLIEAMASYLPIVSFKTKGGIDLIKNNKNGYLVDNKNFTYFSKKIIQFYKKKPNLKKFNDIYLRKFDLKNVAKNTIEIYKKFT